MPDISKTVGDSGFFPPSGSLMTTSRDSVTSQW